MTRIATLGIGAAVVSAVAVGVAVRVFQPAQLWAFAAVAVLLGLTYGVVGVVVGLLFDELGGVYVMLLVPLVDVLLFQNPLASDLPGWTEYLPGHHATAALFDAAFTATVEVGTVLGAIGYAAVLTGLCVVVFGRYASNRSRPTILAKCLARADRRENEHPTPVFAPPPARVSA